MKDSGQGKEYSVQYKIQMPATFLNYQASLPIGRPIFQWFPYGFYYKKLLVYCLGYFTRCLYYCHH
jgi:hypothetical protein